MNEGVKEFHLVAEPVVRELALIKVRADSVSRAEVLQIVEVYRAHVVDVTLDSLIVQVTGAEERVDSLIQLLSHFGIIEMARHNQAVIATTKVKKSTMNTHPASISPLGRRRSPS